ncbi:UDP-glucose 4-epimerase [Vreelandella sulfidaeris]|uniref:UDP-glucose 4-epimerase n=1 Tax=Vreelandella sulfidaeris TaxID=115553 RepID=A0A455U509_9GAMM|nr:UDP-glucose 4-epimerase [Halomonas sulfidaeris]
MAILVTGGAGYIGSHTVVELLQAGHNVVVVDNLSNASIEALKRVESITGKKVLLVEGDIRDRVLLDRIFSEHSIEAVMHFAGLKAVGESVQKPLVYYENNVAGSVTLCQAMQAAGVYRLVFSSSATVYGEPPKMPIHEDFPTGVPTNPYGRSKLMVEEILKDLALSDERWAIALLRYFNPVGAHESGLIGEDPQGVPNNLLPYIAQVAIGRLDKLAVYGGDYLTPDGTGIRDYIHVVDLANGHLKALDVLGRQNGVNTWNLGTGREFPCWRWSRHLSKRVAGPFRILLRRVEQGISLSVGPIPPKPGRSSAGAHKEGWHI